MSIKNEIAVLDNQVDSIEACLADINSALNEKGVEPADKLSKIAQLIRGIEAGGGSDTLFKAGETIEICFLEGETPCDKAGQFALSQDIHWDNTLHTDKFSDEYNSVLEYTLTKDTNDIHMGVAPNSYVWYFFQVSKENGKIRIEIPGKNWDAH